MKFKQLLAKEINNKELSPYLPSSYQKLGDICLIKLNKHAEQHKKIIGKAILNLFPYFRTVCLQREIRGELREPAIEVIADNKNTETIHTEFGYKFKLDIAKIMWSKGNHGERKQLMSEIKQLNKKNSLVVVDMFAGVGYWCIPIANLVKRIYAIDKNKTSIKYLEENIRLNRITNTTIILNDCRNVKLKEKADVVLMGYFPNTIKFLPTAFKLSKQNAIIYYHDIAPNEDVLRAKLSNYKILKIRKIKEYAPRMAHYVVTLQQNKSKL